MVNMKTINVFANSTIMGLASACDTLFSQVYGSKNKKNCGVILQRSVIVLLLCCLPLSTLFLNIEPLLRLTGQEPVVARLAGQYSKYFLLGIPAQAVFQPITKYLQAQSIVFPSMIICIIANVFNALLHALFLIYWQLGIRGASVALALSNWSVVGLHVLYIVCWKVYKKTWTGLSLDCLQDWGQFFSLAVPGMVMTCLEWWAFEITTFLAGWLGEVQLAAYVIADSLITFSFVLMTGISTAVSVRVGNHLGAGRPDNAMTSSRVSLVLTGLAVLITTMLAFSLRTVFPKIYTPDRSVQVLASALVLQVCLLIGTDGIQCVLGGVIRGAGHQKYGAIVNLFAYYVICLPVSGLLMFHTSIGVAGAYWGFLIGSTFEVALFLVRLLKMDWKAESTKAKARAGEEESDTDDDDFYITEFSVTERTEKHGSSTRTSKSGEEDLYQEQTSVIKLEAIDTANKEIELTDVEAPLLQAEDERGTSNSEDRAVRQKYQPTGRTRLSTKQLVIRRGAFISGCVAIFIAGLVMSFYCQEFCYTDWDGTLETNGSSPVQYNLTSSTLAAGKLSTPISLIHSDS